MNFHLSHLSLFVVFLVLCVVCTSPSGWHDIFFFFCFVFRFSFLLRSILFLSFIECVCRSCRIRYDVMVLHSLLCSSPCVPQFFVTAEPLYLSRRRNQHGHCCVVLDRRVESRKSGVMCRTHTCMYQIPRTTLPRSRGTIFCAYIQYTTILIFVGTKHTSDRKRLYLSTDRSGTDRSNPDLPQRELVQKLLHCCAWCVSTPI